MFSSRLSERRQWTRPRWWPAVRTLRGRLLAAILALFTVVSLIVGVVSTVALKQYLTGQLDQQLTAASNRVVGPDQRRPGPPAPLPGDLPSGTELVPPGQPVKTIGGR